MTITGVLILTLLFTIVILAMALTATAKRADKAMAEAIQNAEILMGLVDAEIKRICTRPAPHMCKVTGPCNGRPKENQTFPAWIAEWEEKAKAEKKVRSMLCTTKEKP